MTWPFDERFYRKLHEHAAHFYGYQVESPIELMFVTAFHLVNDGHPAGLHWEIIPQSEVFCSGGIIYRVDFELIAYVGHGIDVHLIVECDGRDFHHADWRQIQRDRKRDQHIEKDHQFKVFRFPGTQIYNDPVGCAVTIIDYATEFLIAIQRRRKARREHRKLRGGAA